MFSIVSTIGIGIDQEDLVKNPLCIFEEGYSSNIQNLTSCHHDSEEDHTSDEDQSEDNIQIPEVLCNLRDILVPIDNDIVFEVDENDSIKISSPGSCLEVKTGDM